MVLTAQDLNAHNAVFIQLVNLSTLALRPYFQPTTNNQYLAHRLIALTLSDAFLFQILPHAVQTAREMNLLFAHLTHLAAVQTVV